MMNTKFTATILAALLALAISADAAEPLKHRWLCVDNSAQPKLIHVDQFRPAQSWAVPLPAGSRDLQVLPGTPGRILVSHGDGAGEYDLASGRKLPWSVGGYAKITTAVRRPNGNTLLGRIDGTVFEVDPAGKELRQIQPPEKFDIRLMRPLDNGNLLLSGAYAKTLLEMDPAGKIVRRIPHPGEGILGDRLPSGNYLTSAGSLAKIVEVDPQGTVVRFVGGKAEHPQVGLEYCSGWDLLPQGNCGLRYLLFSKNVYSCKSKDTIINGCWTMPATAAARAFRSILTCWTFIAGWSGDRRPSSSCLATRRSRGEPRRCSRISRACCGSTFRTPRCTRQPANLQRRLRCSTACGPCCGWRPGEIPSASVTCRTRRKRPTCNSRWRRFAGSATRGGGRNRGGVRVRDRIVGEHLDRYWGQLSAGPEDPCRERTTNGLESWWGNSKRRCRKRHGRKKLTREFRSLPAEYMLIANLENPKYVELLLDGDLSKLAEKLADAGRTAGPWITVAFCPATAQPRPTAQAIDSARRLPRRIGPPFTTTTAEATSHKGPLVTIGRQSAAAPTEFRDDEPATLALTSLPSSPVAGVSS